MNAALQDRFERTAKKIARLAKHDSQDEYIQDRKAKTRQSIQDIRKKTPATGRRNRTPGTGHLGKETRKGLKGQDSQGRTTGAGHRG